MNSIDEIKATLMAILDMTTDEEIVNKIADAYKSYFTALTGRGFSRDEALQILSKIPIGGTKTSS